MSQKKVFVSLKSRTSWLLNSGITARTPNIFSLFLFDYTISAVPYKRSVNKSTQAITTTGTSHSDQLHYIITVFEAVCCKVFFLLMSPNLFQLVNHRVIQYETALASSTLQTKKLQKIKRRIYIFSRSMKASSCREVP